MRGPVSSVHALAGYVCVAVGPKLMLFSFEDGESLIGIAFLDTNFAITSMRSLKSTLIIGDVYKGLWFIGYQEETT